MLQSVIMAEINRYFVVQGGTEQGIATHLHIALKVEVAIVIVVIICVIIFVVIFVVKKTV